jgi:coniferyl-aldehyde dehydrogenase
MQLALAPAVAALAAGNRVMLKPSEMTPATSALLRELVAAAFADDEFSVILGDASVGAAFAAMPFDHLFFTGSTAIGRKVAQAAAANLTPVTLELGGKSPALFDVDADLDVAVPRLLVGKLLNAGQTCIAPDYALVPASRVDAFESAVARALPAIYPDAVANPDFASIVNAAHYERLAALVDDARARGARIVRFGGDDAAATAAGPLPRRFPPTLVVGVDDRMAIMREEIFGPLLPIEVYATLDEAIGRINARPHPLAMYWFGANRTRRAHVLEQTLAGGVTLDDTLWHFVHGGLPFGGVAASGIGAYHGAHGFTTFSHMKPVLRQSRLAAGALLYPPYGRRFETVLKWLSRLTA